MSQSSLVSTGNKEMRKWTLCVCVYECVIILLRQLKTGRRRKGVGGGDEGRGSGLLRDTDIVVLVQQKKT